MGRPRTVIAMNRKHLTKKEIEERQRSESYYKTSQEELTAYDYLSEEAQAEFERIKKNAFWLDNLDRLDLNLYCFYFERITAILKEYGQRDENGELQIPPEVIEMKGGDGCSKLVANPLRKAIRDYHSELRKLSTKLGIATVDRLKLVAPGKETKVNKFAKFL